MNVNWGSDTGIRFLTKDGILHIKKGKVYDENFKERPEWKISEKPYHIEPKTEEDWGNPISF